MPQTSPPAGAWPQASPLAGALPQAPLSTGQGWTFCRFHDLGVDNLYDALALRCRVFVLEQGPFQDPDGVDPHCWHLLGRDAHGVLQAYLRIVDAGVKYPEPSIGRVITSIETRATGLGRRLMAEGLARCAQVWPGCAVRISAQSRLERFYVGFGFQRTAPDHIEDGIPHMEMRRPGDPPAAPTETA